MTSPTLGLSSDELLSTDALGAKATRLRTSGRPGRRRGMSLVGASGAQRLEPARVAVDRRRRRRREGTARRALQGRHGPLRVQPLLCGADARLERSALQKIGTSARSLMDNLHRVPIMVIPTIEAQPEGIDLFLQANLWGSILPAVWSFMLALRDRGLGSAWTTVHLHHARRGGRAARHPARSLHPGRLVPRGVHPRDRLPPRPATATRRSPPVEPLVDLTGCHGSRCRLASATEQLADVRHEVEERLVVDAHPLHRAWFEGGEVGALVLDREVVPDRRGRRRSSRARGRCRERTTPRRARRAVLRSRPLRGQRSGRSGVRWRSRPARRSVGEMRPSLVRPRVNPERDRAHAFCDRSAA